VNQANTVPNPKHPLHHNRNRTVTENGTTAAAGNCGLANWDSLDTRFDTRFNQILCKLLFRP